jgi:general stress protein YciG
MSTIGEKNTGTDRPKRGFAAMDENKQRQIASMGGKSVPAQHRKFSTDRQFASKVGRKGGLNVLASERSFSKDHQFASEAGRKGGEASGRRRARVR